MTTTDDESIYVNENFHKYFMKRSISEIGASRTLPHPTIVHSADNSPMRYGTRYGTLTGQSNGHSKMPSRIKNRINKNNSNNNHRNQHTSYSPNLSSNHSLNNSLNHSLNPTPTHSPSHTLNHGPNHGHSQNHAQNDSQNQINHQSMDINLKYKNYTENTHYGQQHAHDHHNQTNRYHDSPKPPLNRSTSHTEFYRIHKTNTLFHNNSANDVTHVYSSPVYDTPPYL